MFTFDRTFLVIDLIAIADPSNPIFIIFIRKGQRFKTIAEKRLLFDQINNIKFDPLVLFGVCYFEVEPLVVATGVDIILQYQIIGLIGISLVIIFVYVEQVATFEMRVKNERAIVIFECSGSYLWSDVWEIIGFCFWFNIDPCDIHEDVSKIMFLDARFKPMVVYILLIINIPKSRSKVLFIFAIQLFNFLLHPTVLKHCIFNRYQPTTHILRIFLNFGQNVFVSSVEFFRVEASCRVDLVGSVLAFKYFASGRDMFENADFSVLGGRQVDGVLFAFAGVIKLGVSVHQRLFFINNIICYMKDC